QWPPHATLHSRYMQLALLSSASRILDPPGPQPRLIFFFLMSPPPPRSTLFPYTTLFRSDQGAAEAGRRDGLLRFPRSTGPGRVRSEEHTSELQSRFDLVCRLLLEKKKGDAERQRLVEIAARVRRLVSTGRPGGRPSLSQL